MTHWEPQPLRLSLGQTFTWFRDEFVPTMELQHLDMEFLDMRQITESVAEIITKFRERILLVPRYAEDEEMQNTNYHDM